MEYTSNGAIYQINDDLINDPTKFDEKFGKGMSDIALSIIKEIEETNQK